MNFSISMFSGNGESIINKNIDGPCSRVNEKLINVSVFKDSSALI